MAGLAQFQVEIEKRLDEKMDKHEKHFQAAMDERFKQTKNNLQISIQKLH